MDIHKPKPWHGVREFLKEYVIIVVGVLTALGAEQVAEALHGRHVVHEAEAAMRSELVDDDLPQAYVRMAVTPCMVRDLDALKSAVDARMPPQQFGVLAKAYLPPIRTWDEAAWKSTAASGAATRMDGARLLGWSHAYTWIPFLQAFGIGEFNATTHLSRSRYRSGAWTAQRADELSDIVDELRTLNVAMAENSGELLMKAKTIGAQLPPAVELRLLAESRKTYGDCVIKPSPEIMNLLQDQTISPEQQRQLNRALGITEP
jgi:hypothetical protein